MTVKLFCVDVDGVMTDGSFWYSAEGKVLKKFGPEDGDALAILNRFVSICFLTADSRGFEISEARIRKDLGFQLDLVSSKERVEWIASRAPLQSVAYMGDSFLDAPLLSKVGVSIVPANASPAAKAVASYVTRAAGGSGAVAEACFYLAKLVGVNPPEFEFAVPQDLV